MRPQDQFSTFLLQSALYLHSHIPHCFWSCPTACQSSRAHDHRAISSFRATIWYPISMESAGTLILLFRSSLHLQTTLKKKRLVNKIRLYGSFWMNNSRRISCYQNIEKNWTRPIFIFDLGHNIPASYYVSFPSIYSRKEEIKKAIRNISEWQVQLISNFF